ncbi:hypothetical protein G7Y89_g9004 [Cudoniella acicularis]|uniref:aspartyl aminopeptidase n=1 Tax=Cudoniella acicularis TaxID=354080 RepID=A0A8H4RHP4_9HELO|nr:hypothetical protein G7Y89_g9004 [Cudoniella acicularis]
MFGFGAAKATSPTSHTVMTWKASKKDIPSTAPYSESCSSPESLEPAIDGPPSPERIRAYMEQMKRSSIFGNNSRTNTFSSASSSFRSRDSTYASTDSLSLSRKSSGRSNTSSMPSSRSERPESTQIFGSIFSRGARKSRRDNALSKSTSSLSTGDIVMEEGSARERYYGRGNSSRRGTVTSTFPLSQESTKRQLISGPYNFQHVTHTRQEQLPNLERSSPMELVSEFSALRASQAPTNGELKGIRAQDLHFDNFSSEALAISSTDDEQRAKSPTAQRHRGVLRKPIHSSQPHHPMVYAKSYDNLRIAPPRPPRSPLSPICPVELPIRTSSRQASVLFETFDPKTITGATYPNAGFRKPLPLVLSTSHASIGQQPDYSSEPSASHALTTPGDEAWPLTASPSGIFGELADVQEEEEEVGSRRSRISVTSTELRASQSVPSLRLRSREQAHVKSDSCVSTVLGHSPPRETFAPPRRPLSPGFKFEDDSWEKDIDYCYEHEIEADCDYQWDQCSIGEVAVTKPSPTISQPPLEFHLEDDDRSIYHGRFRPSLLIPLAFDVPELSPMSNVSALSSNPRTPQINHPRPGHGRSNSHASSFKESHGFTLSPTLLIPSDFQSQLDQDAAYDHHFGNNNATSGTIFEQEPFNPSVSPVDESSSSISYRSSNFSRGSARSSSSTRMSGTNSRVSQDSMLLLSHAAGINQAHRSIGSASSLPDLIPSSIRKSETLQDPFEIPTELETHEVKECVQVQSPLPETMQHQHNTFQVIDTLEETAPILPAAIVNMTRKLDTIGESLVAPSKDAIPRTPLHGRKISAPVVSQTSFSNNNPSFELYMHIKPILLFRLSVTRIPITLSRSYSTHPSLNMAPKQISAATAKANDFIDFLNASPTPYHAVHSAIQRLSKAGFEEIKERDSWSSTLQPGGKYYLTRNASTIVAFGIGKKWKPGNAIAMIGTHTDSPCLRLKPVSKKTGAGFMQVGVETYGAGIWHTWFDRDLSIAGRAMVKDGKGNIVQKLVKVERPILRIPTLAIHLDRSTNFDPNKETELFPIAGLIAAELNRTGAKAEQTEEEKPEADQAFRPLKALSERHHPYVIEIIAEHAGVEPEDVVDFEMVLYDTQKSCIGGINNELIFSARLDNLGMTYCAVDGLIESLSSPKALESESSIRLIACFDHEEAGSLSAQGAAGNTLPSVVRRLAVLPSLHESGSDTSYEKVGRDAEFDISAAYEQSLSTSFLISADMAHSVNPNYTQKYEADHRPEMNKGTVIKINANQKYVTNSPGIVLLQEVARRAKQSQDSTTANGVPLQLFVVRNDSPCGGTIGPMLSAALGTRTLDLGNPQLSMHSIRECGGVYDVEHGVRLLESFFEHYSELESKILVD